MVAIPVVEGQAVTFDLRGMIRDLLQALLKRDIICGGCGKVGTPTWRPLKASSRKGHALCTVEDSFSAWKLAWNTADPSCTRSSQSDADVTRDGHLADQVQSRKRPPCDQFLGAWELACYHILHTSDAASCEPKSAVVMLCASASDTAVRICQNPYCCWMSVYAKAPACHQLMPRYLTSPLTYQPPSRAASATAICCLMPGLCSTRDKRRTRFCTLPQSLTFR